MKILIILLFTLLPKFAYSFGGISGGGGDLIFPKFPSQTQSVEKTKTIILNSKKNLNNFLIYKYTLYVNNKMETNEAQLYSKVFKNSDKNIFETFDSLIIRIPKYSSCFDLNGKNYDGSTISIDKNIICISAFNLAIKSDYLEMNNQSAALIFHELAEILGLSDQEAIQLQNSYLNYHK